jgi:hypothetical protein
MSRKVVHTSERDVRDHILITAVNNTGYSCDDSILVHHDPFAQMILFEIIKRIQEKREPWIRNKIVVVLSHDKTDAFYPYGNTSVIQSQKGLIQPEQLLACISIQSYVGEDVIIVEHSKELKVEDIGGIEYKTPTYFIGGPRDLCVYVPEMWPSTSVGRIVNTLQLLVQNVIKM